MIPKTGETIKVCLPGETPFAICVEQREASWMGCIINKLFREYSEIEQAQWLKQEWKNVAPLPELHKFKKFDVVEFVPGDFEFRGGISWVPLSKIEDGSSK